MTIRDRFDAAGNQLDADPRQARSAIAVKIARLFTDARARSRQLEILYEASSAINASLSLKNVMRAIMMSLIRALETHSALALGCYWKTSGPCE